MIIPEWLAGKKGLAQEEQMGKQFVAHIKGLDVAADKMRKAVAALAEVSKALAEIDVETSETEEDDAAPPAKPEKIAPKARKPATPPPAEGPLPIAIPMGKDLKLFRVDPKTWGWGLTDVTLLVPGDLVYLRKGEQTMYHEVEGAGRASVIRVHATTSKDGESFIVGLPCPTWKKDLEAERAA